MVSSFVFAKFTWPIMRETVSSIGRAADVNPKVVGSSPARFLFLFDSPNKTEG